jgi:hypothetical protein
MGTLQVLEKAKANPVPRFDLPRGTVKVTWGEAYLQSEHLKAIYSLAKKTFGARVSIDQTKIENAGFAPDGLTPAIALWLVMDCEGRTAELKVYAAGACGATMEFVALKDEILMITSKK